MYRIRFHGRGGQGLKTASRMLGNAFFLEGYEVQDAPRYGAERRGAPIFAYVRAAKHAIRERGIIKHPDLVIVADESLVGVPNAGVLDGLEERTYLLISTHETPEIWHERIKHPGRILTVDKIDVEDPADAPYVGASVVGAAARLLGVISRENLEAAIREELSSLPKDTVDENVKRAVAGFEQEAGREGLVSEGKEMAVSSYAPPSWIDIPFDDFSISAPAIHAGATSVEVRTGLWRTLRPVIDYDRCNRCNWVCSTFCPDSAIYVDEEGYPHIDLDHCKGCMICVAQCPPHAIGAVSEEEAAKEDEKAGRSKEPQQAEGG